MVACTPRPQGQSYCLNFHCSLRASLRPITRNSLPALTTLDRTRHEHNSDSHLIIHVLVCSIPSLPPDISLPFTMNKDSAHLLHIIYEVQIYVRDNVLEYVIYLPLVNKSTQRLGLKRNYQVFKLHN